MKQRHPLNGTLGPGATKVVVITPPMQLSNKGGIATLVDEEGLKVTVLRIRRRRPTSPVGRPCSKEGLHRKLSGSFLKNR
jgi:hypothetical protein